MHIIAGLFKNRTIASPKGMVTRPTSSRLREALFNICQNDVEGARFLDLFAGSGAMGLEALSRGAIAATFIDNNRESIRCIQKNIDQFQLKDSSQTLQGDVFQSLKNLCHGGLLFDLIYADPPYETQMKDIPYSTLVARFVDQHRLLNPEGSLFIEESSEVSLSQETFQTLQLKSVRKLGRSVLYHFIKASETIQKEEIS